MTGLGGTYNVAPTGFFWTIASGDIDLLRTYWQPSSGLQSLDLNGTTTGSIYQDFTFSSGGAWAISFDLSANPDLYIRGDGLGSGLKNVRVDFGTPGSMSTLGIWGVDSAPRTISDMQWVTITTPEVVVSDSLVYRLQFTSMVSGYSGPALDNIQILAIPEPGFAAFFCTAAIGCAMLHRRRN